MPPLRSLPKFAEPSANGHALPKFAEPSAKGQSCTSVPCLAPDMPRHAVLRELVAPCSRRGVARDMLPSCSRRGVACDTLLPPSSTPAAWAGLPANVFMTAISHLGRTDELPVEFIAHDDKGGILAHPLSEVSRRTALDGYGTSEFVTPALTEHGTHSGRKDVTVHPSEAPRKPAGANALAMPLTIGCLTRSHGARSRFAYGETQVGMLRDAFDDAITCMTLFKKGSTSRHSPVGRSRSTLAFGEIPTVGDAKAPHAIFHFPPKPHRQVPPRTARVVGGC